MNSIVAVNADIIPVTRARGKLGRLVDKASKTKYFILTKGGNPRAAIVDFGYLTNLENAVSRIYQKTFIDPKLLPYTREFSGKEIAEWLREDKI